MSIQLGVIADDFTGATDIASFMSDSGWKVVQFMGFPRQIICALLIPMLS